MKKEIFLVVFSFFIINAIYSLPISKKKKTEDKYDMKYSGHEGLTLKQAQDQEYFRYLTQVFAELQRDEDLKAYIKNTTEEDLRTGKMAEVYDLAQYGVRNKLDEVKRMEVEHQRELLRKGKHHMKEFDGNDWNPIHHDNKDTFVKKDLKKLLLKHQSMLEERDTKRREEFKEYEMQKEHNKRKNVKKMSEQEREKEEEMRKEMLMQEHEKIYEPGEKKQLKEVWEKEHGLDPDSFDEKTLFKLHDKNSDGYLDVFEIETLFLGDLDKVYNESSYNYDAREKDEEMARMREHVLGKIDKDKDGLISQDEYISNTLDEDFNGENEWKPLSEQEQFSEEELKEFEKIGGHEEEGDNGDHEQNEEGHHEQNNVEHHEQQEE